MEKSACVGSMTSLLPECVADVCLAQHQAAAAQCSRSCILHAFDMSRFLRSTFRVEVPPIARYLDSRGR